MEVTKVENVTRVYKIGKVETAGPARRQPVDRERRVHRPWSGPSGSGKTTLLQLIGCLDQPTSGRVSSTARMSAASTATSAPTCGDGTIGFIFQFFALIPTLTAYENIEMPLLLTRQSAVRAPRAGDAAAGGGGSDRPRPPPPGPVERRRAAARGRGPRPGRRGPSLILADEPTANLDTDNGRQVMEIMQRLNQETGVTFVFATHDPRVINTPGA